MSTSRCTLLFLPIPPLLSSIIKIGTTHKQTKANILLNMIRTLISILALLGLPATLMAFSAHPTKIMTRQSPAATTTLYYHPAVFEKAVECAQNYGMCDVDELLNLAERKCCFVLYKYGCSFELASQHSNCLLLH